MPDAQWYFVQDNQRAGPVTVSELQDMALHGMIGPDTLVWTDGMADWQDANQHFSFDAVQATGLTVPPPIARQFQNPTDDMGFPLTSASQRTVASPYQSVGGIGPDGLWSGAPSRGFGEAISICFGKFATFRGRASRSEYWYFFLFSCLLNITVGLIPLIGQIIMLVLFLPTLAVSVRRLHDLDRSGWWIGLFYIALVGGGIMAAVFLGVPYSTVDYQSGQDMALVGILGILGILAMAWAITLFVFTLLKGTSGPNRFG